MTLILVGVGLLMLMLPGAVASKVARPRPASCSRMYAASLVLGLTALLVGLILHAGPVLAALARADDLPTADDMIAHLSPGGVPAALVSSTLAALLGYRFSRGLIRLRQGRRRSRAAPHIGTHLRRNNHDVVVVPARAPVAYSIGGKPSQVIVSQDLVARLSRAELAAILGHEQAHLRNGHQRYLAAATLVEQTVGLLPLVRRGAVSLRMAIERWADDDAAGNDLARRAVLRRALLRAAFDHRRARMSDSPAALMQRSRALTKRPVAQRDRLETIAVAAVLTLFSVGVATFGHWLTDVPALLAFFGT